VGSLARQGVKVQSDFEAEDVGIVVASPDVTTSSVFPLYAQKKFLLGDEIEILLGFANNAESEIFNITHIIASFNYPLDFSFYIQNFTAKEYNIPVMPSSQISVSYTFFPDPLLEPRDFGLVATVFYRDQQGVNWTSVFFNSTVDVSEQSGSFDGQTFFTFLALFAILGLIGYGIYRTFGPFGKRKHSARGAEFGTKQRLDNDWLAGTSADPNYGGKKNLRKRINKSQ